MIGNPTSFLLELFHYFQFDCSAPVPASLGCSAPSNSTFSTIMVFIIFPDIFLYFSMQIRRHPTQANHHALSSSSTSYSRLELDDVRDGGGGRKRGADIAILFRTRMVMRKPSWLAHIIKAHIFCLSATTHILRHGRHWLSEALGRRRGGPGCGCTTTQRR